MTSQLVAVSSLLLGSAFLLIAGGIHGILLPVQGSVVGFSITELGLLGTSWSAGYVAGCFLIPNMVRRAGHVRTYGAMGSIAAVTILLNALLVTPWVWIPLRAVTGFAFAGAAMVVESWLNERASRENRGTLFSVYQMVNYGASTAGQLMLAIRPPSQDFFYAIGAIFYCLAVLPTALSTAKTPQPIKQASLDVRRLYAISPVGAVVAFLIGLVNGAFGTLGPVYGQKIGLAVSDIAMMMAGAVLGGSLIQYPLGRLSDRMDRRRVLIGVCAGAIVVGLAIAAFHPRAALVVTILAIIFGAMIYPTYALTVAHANDFAGPDEFVKVASSLLVLYGFGCMIGPIGASVAMERIAPEGMFIFTALVQIVIIGYVAYRISQRPEPNRVLREQFQAIAEPKTTTPETATLDPRSSPPAAPPASEA